MSKIHCGGGDLQSYLDEAKHRGFVPRPRYYELGDYLTYFWREDRCLATRVDKHLTLYHSIADEELVGLKISGVTEARTK